MHDVGKIKSIVEALLIVSENGLSKNDILAAITEADGKDVEQAIDMLEKEYGSSGRSFNIAQIAGRYRIVTQPEYMPWISNLYEKPMDRLTGPSLETLAIAAYKQPATRAEIEKVRGVNVGGVLKTLLEKDLLTIRGRKDVPGKPLLYGTTDKFLEIFGLNSLEDLPELKDFSPDDLEFGKPQEVVEKDVPVSPQGEGEGKETEREAPGADVRTDPIEAESEKKEGSEKKESDEDAEEFEGSQKENR